jgi:hypothetical protein
MFLMFDVSAIALSVPKSAPDLSALISGQQNRSDGFAIGFERRRDQYSRPPSSRRQNRPRWEPAITSLDGYPIKDWGTPSLCSPFHDGNLIGHASGGRDRRAT